jgi:hypothetical protein
VRKIFKAEFKRRERISPRPVPRWVGIDEVNLLSWKRSDKTDKNIRKPQCILTDLETGVVYDLLRNRDLDTVRTALYRMKAAAEAPRAMGLAIAAVTLSVVLLSSAGIHALMSFTVARRRKEIGIRAALGANPRRLLASIFSRAASQLAISLGIGAAAAVFVNQLIDVTGGRGMVYVPAAAALMMVVGLLAALGPARRGLRIEPMEALRAD